MTDSDDHTSWFGRVDVSAFRKLFDGGDVSTDSQTHGPGVATAAAEETAVDATTETSEPLDNPQEEASEKGDGEARSASERNGETTVGGSPRSSRDESHAAAETSGSDQWVSDLKQAMGGDVSSGRSGSDDIDPGVETTDECPSALESSTSVEETEQASADRAERAAEFGDDATESDATDRPLEQAAEISPFGQRGETPPEEASGEFDVVGSSRDDTVGALASSLGSGDDQADPSPPERDDAERPPSEGTDDPEEQSSVPEADVDGADASEGSGEPADLKAEAQRNASSEDVGGLDGSSSVPEADIEGDDSSEEIAAPEDEEPDSFQQEETNDASQAEETGVAASDASGAADSEEADVAASDADSDVTDASGADDAPLDPSPTSSTSQPSVGELLTSEGFIEDDTDGKPLREAPSSDGSDRDGSSREAASSEELDRDGVSSSDDELDLGIPAPEDVSSLEEVSSFAETAADSTVFGESLQDGPPVIKTEETSKSSTSPPGETDASESASGSDATGQSEEVEPDESASPPDSTGDALFEDVGDLEPDLSGSSIGRECSEATDVSESDAGPEALEESSAEKSDPIYSVSSNDLPAASSSEDVDAASSSDIPDTTSTDGLDDDMAIAGAPIAPDPTLGGEASDQHDFEINREGTSPGTFSRAETPARRPSLEALDGDVETSSDAGADTASMAEEDHRSEGAEPPPADRAEASEASDTDRNVEAESIGNSEDVQVGEADVQERDEDEDGDNASSADNMLGEQFEASSLSEISDEMEVSSDDEQTVEVLSKMVRDVYQDGDDSRCSQTDRPVSRSGRSSTAASIGEADASGSDASSERSSSSDVPRAQMIEPSHACEPSEEGASSASGSAGTIDDTSHASLNRGRGANACVSSGRVGSKVDVTDDDMLDDRLDALHVQWRHAFETKECAPPMERREFIDRVRHKIERARKQHDIDRFKMQVDNSDDMPRVVVTPVS